MTIHLGAVVRTLRRLGVTESAVDDASQKVFLVAARRLDEIEYGSEGCYLFGVATKVAADVRRSVRRRSEVPLDAVDSTPVAPVDTPDEQVEAKRTRERLMRLLQSLPTELRDALLLFDVFELSAPEVADALGIPLGTVASRVRRARAALRRSIEAQNVVRLIDFFGSGQ